MLAKTYYDLNVSLGEIPYALCLNYVDYLLFFFHFIV